MSDIKNTGVFIDFDNEQRELVFSLNVLNDAADRYGKVDDVLNILTKDYKELTWLATQMFNEGTEIWNYRHPDNKKSLVDERQFARFIDGIGGFNVLAAKVQEAMLKGLPEDKVKQVEEIGKNLMAAQSKRKK